MLVMYDKGCKCGIAVRLITATLLVAAAMAYGSVASAQLAPTASLSDEITAQYKLTKFGVDSTGFTVTEAGTVLMVQKGGILAFPPTDMGVLATKYENGAIHSPSPVLTGMFKQNVSTRFLTAGERVYVSKLDINVKTSKISVSIVECDSCNGVQNASSYKAVVTFQFAKGYLDTANPADVETTMAQVLAVDSDPNQGGGDQGGQAQGGGAQQQQAAPAAAPAQQPAATVNIAVGQTIDQVKAALGEPQKTVNLGTKQILVYKDLKVTLIKGKVTDVE
jgi:hypothetical protein